MSKPRVRIPIEKVQTIYGTFFQVAERDPKTGETREKPGQDHIPYDQRSVVGRDGTICDMLAEVLFRRMPDWATWTGDQPYINRIMLEVNEAGHTHATTLVLPQGIHNFLFGTPESGAGKSDGRPGLFDRKETKANAAKRLGLAESEITPERHCLRLGELVFGQNEIVVRRMLKDERGVSQLLSQVGDVDDEPESKPAPVAEPRKAS